MIRRPPRSTLDRSSAASDVYKRQLLFTAFNTRDLETYKNYFSEDLEFFHDKGGLTGYDVTCLLYTSPSPRDRTRSRMPSSA